MKKVVYSIRKVRNSDEKLSGLGFINDEGTLFCKCVSKNGKQYTRAFDDVEQHCLKVTFPAGIWNLISVLVKSIPVVSSPVTSHLSKYSSSSGAFAVTVTSVCWVAVNYREPEKQIERRVEEGSEKKREKQ